MCVFGSFESKSTVPVPDQYSLYVYEKCFQFYVWLPLKYKYKYK